ncbi:MAG: MBL fold metallo-hydrolase [Candidatus Sungbacteria bacterium]|nr:MBL fold metallo-hydrolase [Candidatus Sungbacteria bacterium]
MARISFHGGAREVTGACYLLKTEHANILVDCGLFQGCDECADMNFRGFLFDPKIIDALFVTHAHVDHIGRIPKLVREGFRGPIFSTAPTKDLAMLLLRDSLSLAAREKERLFEEKDMDQAFSQMKTLRYHESIHLGDADIMLRNAGHILGSSFVEIHAEGKKILFTGDLGNIPSLLLPGPEIVPDAEYMVIESTYGGKEHEDPRERISQLERAVEDVAARGGTLLIPAFATERTQDILHLLNELLLYKRIPEIPVFVDSPLAIRVTEVFERYPEYYKEEIKELFLKHPKLFKFKKLQFTESAEDSKKINNIIGPKVIIAGSGMMNGGRVLHHARRYLSDQKSILLIIGYQAAGSLGRRLIDGETMVKIFGEDIPVHAEIRKINGFSAHADNSQLYDFVYESRNSLKQVFVVQGEEARAMHFMQEIRDRLGTRAEAPILGDEMEI